MTTEDAVDEIFSQAARYLRPDADPKLLQAEDRIAALERKVEYLERRFKIIADLLLAEGDGHA